VGSQEPAEESMA